MDRRTALHRIGVLMGGAVSASTVAGVLGGCRAGTGANGPRTLTDGRDELVATLAELIIPRTDTPGARDAGVHEFADNMLTDWYEAEETNRFLEGLREVERLAGARAFVELDPEEQVEILTRMEEQAEAWRATGSPGDPPFFVTIKSLTLFGYYTSEVGATLELRVNPMGVYEADVPYEQIGRAWA